MIRRYVTVWRPSWGGCEGLCRDVGGETLLFAVDASYKLSVSILSILDRVVIHTCKRRDLGLKLSVLTHLEKGAVESLACNVM